MRKNKIILLIMTLVLICIGLAIPVHNYYNPASERSAYTCQQHQDDTLRLAMIGDSWVFNHYPYNDTLASMIRQIIKKPTIVSAYGLCGKTSKEVYQSIFEDQTMRNILEKGTDYCFVSVGINDTYKKMGAKYYAQSSINILRFFLKNNIKPILLEIPNYDINYAYEHQTADRKLFRQLSMLLTRSELDCRQEYRQALAHELVKTSIGEQIQIIHFPGTLEYYKSDRMHLNEKGYHILDSCIANEIHP